MKITLETPTKAEPVWGEESMQYHLHPVVLWLTGDQLFWLRRVAEATERIHDHASTGQPVAVSVETCLAELVHQNFGRYLDKQGVL